jgi:GntR family transcriptional regulator, transcriptional repressor for pyruvate dehydrogenase complex
MAVARPDKISDRVAREILDEIMRTKMRPGDHLPPESAMQSNYGVSRGSLREALRILEVHGVIRVKSGPGGGPIVAAANAYDFGRSAALYFNFHGGTMKDLMAARRIIEPLLARMAAESITTEGASRLREYLDHGWESQPIDHRDLTSPDFHVIVSNLAGNVIMGMFCESLASIQNERLSRLLPAFEIERASEIHRRIGQVIIDGDGDSAERLMFAHLQAVEDQMELLAPGSAEAPIGWW